MWSSFPSLFYVPIFATQCQQNRLQTSGFSVLQHWKHRLNLIKKTGREGGCEEKERKREWERVKRRKKRGRKRKREGERRERERQIEREREERVNRKKERGSGRE